LAASHHVHRECVSGAVQERPIVSGGRGGPCRLRAVAESAGVGTESIFLQGSEPSCALLTRLGELGVRISLDDFGAGYSSLSYLRSFHFNKIKIDKSFIRDLSIRESSAAIVRAVCGLARSFGATTTAEGVETDEQVAHIRAEGCNDMQGHLFSMPRPVSEVPALLARLLPAPK
jgi:EAL domain-containing protein (putative c-di-GMP-specific phosphodiesterase class I)